MIYTCTSKSDSSLIRVTLVRSQDILKTPTSAHLQDLKMSSPTRPRQLISSGSAFEAEIGYSRAVVDGDFVFVSGCTGYVQLPAWLNESTPIFLGFRKPYL